MPDKALILGINAYESVSPLRGCVNDARNIAKLMTDVFGFSGENVRVLLDQEVRKPRVKSEIGWLFEDAAPGDRLALHFSGHGSQITDTSADEADDSLDELICLQDMDFARSGTFITDDELGKLLKKCPRGAFLTVFLDCCNSGTGTRKVLPPGRTQADHKSPCIIEEATALRMVAHQLRPRSRPPSVTELTRLARGVQSADAQDQVLARYATPPADMFDRIERIRQVKSQRSATPPFAVLAQLNHVLLAACQADQTAADAYIDGDYNGAFSFYLAKSLRENGRAIDRQDLMTRVGQLLKADRFEQQPRLEAASVIGPLFTRGGSTEPDVPAPPPTPAPPDPTPPPTNPGTAPPDIALPTPPPAALPGAEGINQILSDLIATYNRLLDLIAPLIQHTPGATEGRAATKELVYVHGIGKHPVRYSDAWWRSMSPFAASLRPGTLASGPGAHDGNRHEVNWSNLVNRAIEDESTSRALDELSALLREELEERRQMLIEATSAVAPLVPESDDNRDLEPDAIRELVNDRFIGNLDDFTRYMVDPALRASVLERFTSVVRPILARGAKLEIIAHSWGTVVAYEGLRQLSLDESLPSQSVHHLFTCGAALSIGLVRHNLFGRVQDGRLPRLVKRWVNVNARGDLVGGRLANRGFAVHDDLVDLPAVGCRVFPPNPVCAHASYFVAQNLEVNQRIFGAFIENDS